MSVYRIKINTNDEFHKQQAEVTVRNIPGVTSAGVFPVCPICDKIDVEEYNQTCFEKDNLVVYLHK